MMPSWLLEKCYTRNPRLLIKSRRLVILSHFAISIETKRWQPGSGTEEPFARFNLASGIEIDWKQFISPSLNSKLFVRLELQISPSVVYFMLMAVKFDGRERITRSSLLVGWLSQCRANWQTRSWSAFPISFIKSSHDAASFPCQSLVTKIEMTMFYSSEINSAHAVGDVKSRRMVDVRSFLPHCPSLEPGTFFSPWRNARKMIS